MSFLLWKWDSGWPSRKTWCRLTAGKVNVYSQSSQQGSVAKQLPPWSYIICKRNTFLFGKWNIGFLGDGGFSPCCFWSTVDLGELDERVTLWWLSSCPDQRERFHPIRDGFRQRPKRTICSAVLQSHGIPGELWHGPVFLCGFSRGLWWLPISLKI